MNKKIGYLLLLCGLGVILASSIMLWRTFYGTMRPPQAFDTENTITLTLPSGVVMNMPLPPQVNRFANLALGFMLMFFLALVGGRIGSLGVKLINGSAVPPARPQEKP